MATTKELENILNQINANKPKYAGNTVSQETLGYQQKLSGIENNAPGAYQSKNQDKISSIMDKITKREPFSYDFNADPLYQNYKDQYVKLGNEAAQNAAASVSALTGGYGNSYATTAASQANQQYLSKLNDIIPELYNAAMSKYQAEADDLYKQFSMYGEQEDRDYSKYRDDVSDYQTNRGYYADRLQQSQANDQWNNTFNYNKYRDEVSDWQNNRDYYTGIYNNSVANDQWQAEFDYQKQRDAVSDSQWQAEMALQQASAARSAARSSSGGSSGGSSRVKANYVNGGKKLSQDQLNFLTRAAYDNATKEGSDSVEAVRAQAGKQYDAGRLNANQLNALLDNIDYYMWIKAQKDTAQAKAGAARRKGK